MYTGGSTVWPTRTLCNSDVVVGAAIDKANRLWRLRCCCTAATERGTATRRLLDSARTARIPCTRLAILTGVCVVWGATRKKHAQESTNTNMWSARASKGKFGDFCRVWHGLYMCVCVDLSNVRRMLGMIASRLHNTVLLFFCLQRICILSNTACNMYYIY